MITAAVKERPIIFSAAMVRAIIDGRKTQTRRVIKRVYDTVGKDSPWAVCPAKQSGWIAWYGLPRLDIIEFTKKAYNHGFKCPYGKPGDLLWVKETCWTQKGTDYALYAADGHQYVADWTKRQSMFMPRWASRITLEITGVRVERLNDISEEDAKAEGCSVGPGYFTAKLNFEMLWHDIYGKKHPWESNPWVWCIEFQRVKAGAAKGDDK